MVDQTLQMVATIRDEMSPALRNIRNALNQFVGSGGPSEAAARFSAMSKTAAPLGREIKQVLDPALRAFGLTSAGVTASVIGLALAMDKASKSAVELGTFAKVTGIHADTLAKYQAVSARLGVPWPTMAIAIERFTTAMRLMHAGRAGAPAGEAVALLDKINQLQPEMRKAFHEIIELSQTNPTAGLERFFTLLGQLPDEQKIILLGQFPEFGFPQALINWSTEVNKLGPVYVQNAEKAQKYRDAMNQLGQSWQNLTKWMQDNLTDDMTKAVSEMTAILSDPGVRKGFVMLAQAAATAVFNLTIAVIRLAGTFGQIYNLAHGKPMGFAGAESELALRRARDPNDPQIPLLESQVEWLKPQSYQIEGGEVAYLQQIGMKENLETVRPWFEGGIMGGLGRGEDAVGRFLRNPDVNWVMSLPLAGLPAPGAGGRSLGLMGVDAISGLYNAYTTWRQQQQKKLQQRQIEQSVQEGATAALKKINFVNPFVGEGPFAIGGGYGPSGRMGAGAGGYGGGGRFGGRIGGSVYGGVGGGVGGPGSVDKQVLRQKLESMVANSSLNGYVPADGVKYGITTGSPKEWAHFLTELAGKESSYNPHNVGDVGKFGTGSRGLFQLSQQDAITYGLQDRPFTLEQLADPDFNAKMAVKIAEIRLRKGGSIGGPGGMAEYWGPLQRGWTPGPDTGGGEGRRFVGMVVHHTGGLYGDRGPQRLADVLRQRGLSVQFFIDRQGKVWRMMPDGSYAAHAGTLEKTPGLGNRNMEGVEIEARGDWDVTEAQRKAAAELIGERAEKYGYDPKGSTVIGHGEGTRRKEWNEGLSTVGAIRAGRLDESLRQGAGFQKARVNVNVDVNAPRGTKVNASGNGIIDETRVNRNLGLESAAP